MTGAAVPRTDFPNYPRADGSTGRWTHNVVSGALYPPDAADLMGHCIPASIGPYSYARIARELAEWHGGAAAL